MRGRIFLPEICAPITEIVLLYREKRAVSMATPGGAVPRDS